MSRKVNLEYFRGKGLLPFQAEVALSFVESEDEKYWEIVMSVGMGKTHLGACLVAYELEEDLDKRILVLAPAAFLEQWNHEILEFLQMNKCTLCPLIVDRKTYLELESNVPVGENPWPVPSVILMSVDLAKREDMVSKLEKVTWDLIIFDESHLLSKGKRRALLERLRKTNVSHRGLLLSAIPQQFENVITKVVNREVVDWEGRLVFPQFEKNVALVYYYRTEEERRFFRELQDFAARLPNNFPYGKLQERNILRAGSSSLYALEGILRKLIVRWRHLRNKIAHNVPWTSEDLASMQEDIFTGSEELEAVEELSEIMIVRAEEFLELYVTLERILDQIDELPVDSKLETVLSYINKFFTGKTKSHLCIWCSFARTAEYLTSSLQDVGLQVWSITGALKAAERMCNLKCFRAKGGVLIATEAASEGVALEYVDECINYDLPANQQIFGQRWGRFLRFGRNRDFRMVALKDGSKALSWEEKLFETLKIEASSERDIVKLT
ncbi:MAG: DEAD/DEAH box helicase family protein [Deltaproteobacteria bacterium]|nr:DEAD/DEAH box helicase family protein [Deltaproteobacteria bacterium]